MPARRRARVSRATTLEAPSYFAGWVCADVVIGLERTSRHRNNSPRVFPVLIAQTTRRPKGVVMTFDVNAFVALLIVLSIGLRAR